MASTPQPTIVRVRRTDQAGSFVLLHITQTGSSPLDLKLVGTEHEHLYHAQIRSSTVKSLQAGSFSGNLDEWKALLQLALLKKRSEDVGPQSLQGLETVAAISASTLTITLRKNIGGITQRLGAIALDQDDEREEVAFPEWVDTAVAAADELREELDSLKASTASHDEQVAKLSAQLEELIQAKQDSEQDLLTKFAALLNSKKLKIRDQQRLLSGAKFDSTSIDTDDDEDNANRSRKAGASRNGKRKATVSQHDEDGHDDNDNDGDENMSDEAEEVTPQTSDVDDESDDGFDAVPKGRSNDRSTKTAESEINEDEVSPPRRGLTHNTKPRPQTSKDASSQGRLRSSGAAAQTVEDDDDEEETDDEL